MSHDLRPSPRPRSSVWGSRIHAIALPASSECLRANASRLPPSSRTPAVSLPFRHRRNPRIILFVHPPHHHGSVPPQQPMTTNHHRPPSRARLARLFRSSHQSSSPCIRKSPVSSSLAKLSRSPTLVFEGARMDWRGGAPSWRRRRMI